MENIKQRSGDLLYGTIIGFVLCTMLKLPLMVNAVILVFGILAIAGAGLVAIKSGFNVQSQTMERAPTPGIPAGTTQPIVVIPPWYQNHQAPETVLEPPRKRTLRILGEED